MANITRVADLPISAYIPNSDSPKKKSLKQQTSTAFLCSSLYSSERVVLNQIIENEIYRFGAPFDKAKRNKCVKAINEQFTNITQKSIKLESLRSYVIRVIKKKGLEAPETSNTVDSKVQEVALDTISTSFQSERSKPEINTSCRKSVLELSSNDKAILDLIISERALTDTSFLKPYTSKHIHSIIDEFAKKTNLHLLESSIKNYLERKNTVELRDLNTATNELLNTLLREEVRKAKTNNTQKFWVYVAKRIKEELQLEIHPQSLCQRYKVITKNDCLERDSEYILNFVTLYGNKWNALADILKERQQNNKITACAVYDWYCTKKSSLNLAKQNGNVVYAAPKIYDLESTETGIYPLIKECDGIYPLKKLDDPVEPQSLLETPEWTEFFLNQPLENLYNLNQSTPTFVDEITNSKVEPPIQSFTIAEDSHASTPFEEHSPQVPIYEDEQFKFSIESYLVDDS